MGLFKKSINEENTRDFFVMAANSILSAEQMKENEQRLNQLKANLPFLKNVKQTDFNRHLSAVNITWLKIALSRYITLRKGFVEYAQLSVKIDDELQKSNSVYNNLKPEIELYSSAIPNPSDGIAMNDSLAELFVAEILGKDVGRTADKIATNHQDFSEAVQAISYLFAGTYDLYTKEIKKWR